MEASAGRQHLLLARRLQVASEQPIRLARQQRQLIVRSEQKLAVPSVHQRRHRLHLAWHQQQVVPSAQHLQQAAHLGRHQQQAAHLAQHQQQVVLSVHSQVVPSAQHQQQAVLDPLRVARSDSSSSQVHSVERLSQILSVHQQA